MTSSLAGEVSCSVVKTSAAEPSLPRTNTAPRARDWRLPWARARYIANGRQNRLTHRNRIGHWEQPEEIHRGWAPVAVGGPQGWNTTSGPGAVGSRRPSTSVRLNGREEGGGNPRNPRRVGRRSSVHAKLSATNGQQARAIWSPRVPLKHNFSEILLLLSQRRLARTYRRGQGLSSHR